jgi:hypothetical protein
MQSVTSIAMTTDSPLHGHLQIIGKSAKYEMAPQECRAQYGLCRLFPFTRMNDAGRQSL